MRCRRAAVRLYLAVGDTPVSAGALANSARDGLFSSRQQTRAMLALPVEGLDRLRLAEFMALCGPVEPQLIITERRALALGLDASTPMALQLPAGADANTILALVTDATNDRKPSAKPASPAATAAIHLVKISQSLPAVLAANLAGHTIACEESIVRVEADAVADFADHATRSLIVASEASVPLNSGTPTRFVVFHDAVGDNQVAIIVGTPDFTNPVPVRLHSACLTGDVFGSRRCDCGDQLRLALASDRRPWRRRHSISGAGGARTWSRQQDADISIAG